MKTPVSQIKSGAIISYVSIFANIVVALVYTPFFIRTLGVEGYGLYNLAISFLATIGILDLAFGNVIAKFISQNRIRGDKETEAKLLGQIIIIYAFISISVFIISALIYFNLENLFGDNLSFLEIKELKTMFLYILAFILLAFFPGSFNGILQAYEYFFIAKSMLLIRVVLPSLIATPFLLSGAGPQTVLIITVIVHICVLILGAILCFKKIPIKFDFKNTFNIKTFKYNSSINIYLISILISITIEQITLNSGQMILAALNGPKTVAIFAVAIQFVKIYQQFATSIYNITFPKFSKLVAEGKSNDELLSLIVKVSKFQLLALGLILSGFIIFGAEFIVLWAGHEFKLTYSMTVILMSSLTLVLIQLPFVSVIQARDNQSFRSRVLIICFILSMGNAYYLAKMFGAFGVVAALAIFSFLVPTAIMNIYYHKKEGLNVIKFWRKILKTSFPICLLVIISDFLYSKLVSLYGFSIIVFLLSIFVFTLFYLLTLFWVCLDRTERSSILKRA